MKQWLIRKSNFWISRPMEHDVLVRMIVDGALGAQDEICAGCDDWFTLQDHAEVLSHFGSIDLRKVFPQPLENTSSTETQELPKTRILQPEVKKNTATVFESSVESRVENTAESSAVTSAKANMEAREFSKGGFWKNVLTVGGIFVGFILFLVWLWSGSY